MDNTFYIGQILLLPYNFTPAGLHLCDGSLLAIEQYQVLFSLLGVEYGGNGQTNFALPKLEAPVQGMRYCIVLEGIYPSRS